MALRAFLELPDGMAIRIGSAGLLLGRHHSCDVQLVDETASRRHALLRMAPPGVELILLGRPNVQVEGHAAGPIEQLGHGARFELPGFTGRVRIDDVEDSVHSKLGVRHGSERIAIRSTPFVIGTGPSADVVITGWPEQALRFVVAQDVLHVEVASGVGTHNGIELAAGAPVALEVGDELGYLGERFRIEHTDPGDTSTVVPDRPALASAVMLEPLPRGGRITLTYGDGDRRVYLPGRRYQLLSTLLVPPAGHHAGDYVPDSDLIPVVWADDDEIGGRQDVNVLITRCRQDLIAAGIAPATLIERAPGGRATRVILADGAKVRTTTD